MTNLKQNFQNLHFMINELKECDAFILFNGYIKMNTETKIHILKEYNMDNLVHVESLNIFGVRVVIDESIQTDCFEVGFENNIEIII